MDAFTYFFTNLAIWNILLVSSGFLFGLLMGHWMWGQFKKRLHETGQELSASQAQLVSLREELTAFQEESDGVAGAWFTERKTLQENLADQGDKLSEVSAQLEESLAREQEVATGLEEAQETLTKLEKNHKAQSKELADTTEAKEQAEKLNKRLEEKAKNWEEEKAKLESSLNREKSTSASLREVVAGLNEVQSGLRSRIDKLEEQVGPADAQEQPPKKTSRNAAKKKSGAKND